METITALKHLKGCLVENKPSELPGSQPETEEAAEVDKTHNMESHDVKKEFEDEALLESLKDIKNDNYVDDDVKNKFLLSSKLSMAKVFPQKNQTRTMTMFSARLMTIPSHLMIMMVQTPSQT